MLHKETKTFGENMACTPSSINFKSRLMAHACALALLTAGLSVPALAQATETTVAFNMQEQSLDAALKEFGVAADRQVMFSKNLVDGKRVDAVLGDLAPMMALDQLLDGTGLVYEVTSSNVILVRAEPKSAAESQQRASTKGENELTQMAQVESSDLPIATAETVPAEERGPTGDGLPATVTGKVTDINNQANLKGAQVEIVETGQKTATDDLGRFRFPQVHPGTYTLSVSYLGYTDNSARVVVESDTDLEQNFGIRGGSEFDEVVVYGSRSARVQSLNQQRVADNNSEVVSADLLGNFTGATISEALRRVSGIAFQQDDVTGEGTNVIVRGLEPDLNTVTLNGVRLPDTSGVGRSGDLSNILADSVGSITVHKSLLPSQDSSGTGGLVEIETKSPLDRPKRYFNASVEGGGRARGFSDDLLMSGTVSGRFGQNDDFGLSGSLQYRKQEFSNVGYRQNLEYGQYLPLSEGGVPSIFGRFLIDPVEQFPFEPDADLVYPVGTEYSIQDTDASNLTATLAGEWQVAQHTNLRLDVQRVESERNNFSRNVRLRHFTNYQPRQVAALGGENRQALGFSGFASLQQGYEINEVVNNTTTLSFRGNTVRDKWNFNYGAGYTKGTSENPVAQALSFNLLGALDQSLFAPEATDPVEGRIITGFSPVNGISDVQFPLYNQAGFDFVNNSGSYNFSGSVAPEIASSNNERISAEFSGRRSFIGKALKYVEVGVFHEIATFVQNPVVAEFDFYFGAGATLADIGGELQDAPLGRIGVEQRIQTLSFENAQQVIRNIPDFAALDDGVLVFPIAAKDNRLVQELTEEAEISGYIQTGFEFGRVEIIGGARINQVDVKTRKFVGPVLIDENGLFDSVAFEANKSLVDLSGKTTDILPRVLMNYRPSENLVFRGGYFLSVARPRIDDLATDPSVRLDLQPRFGPSGNQPQLSVTLGNPNLKPAVTHNLDLSIEKYNGGGGLLKLGVFYKRINNFIQSNSTQGFSVLDDVPLPDDPRFQNLPANIQVLGFRPVNSDEAAEIWGAEAGVEHQFNSLPSFWGGLGVFGNVVYSDSSRNIQKTWFTQPLFNDAGSFVGFAPSTDYILEGERFDQQPKYSGTMAVTYNKYNIDASLSYTIQDRRQELILDHGLGLYNEGVDSLDFRFEYRFGQGEKGAYRLWVEGSDLLNGPNDPTLVKTHGKSLGVLSSSTYIGGRSLKVGASATF